MEQIPPSIRKAAITTLKQQRSSLIRRLNETEERIAVLETAETLLSTERSAAMAYAMQLMKRLDESAKVAIIPTIKQ
jgi:hypothetical protein